ncbi:hypothetical protein glysoja_021918 [Glycine soja]|nr:hypothetical protein glysoja_021918 [Glycine soja]
MGPQGSLSHLEQLQVENCDELVAIVANDEADNEEANKEIVIFSSITSLRLSDLPKLSCIYPGMHSLEWRMLKELHVKHCQKLKFFASEFQNSPDLNPDGEDRFSTDQQAIVSLEKVTPCLEVMSLGKEEAMMIEQGKLDIDLPKLNSLKLQGFQAKQGDIFPFVFGLKVSVSLPTIEKLVLLDSSFKEIFPCEKPSNGIDYDKILSQLKRLKLLSLPELKSIGLEHSWISPFIQNLKTLLVRECHDLANLTPSTVSFSNLIKLIVKDCDGLKYLFTFSTAKTLVVLKEIYITKCKSLKTIVAKDGEEGGDDEDNDVEEEGQGEGNEDEDEDQDNDVEEEGQGEGNEDEDEDEDEEEANAKGDGNEDENKGNNDEDGNQGEDNITFKKLERLTLSSLPKLKSFYTGSSSLNFPCLKVMSFSKPCRTNLFRNFKEPEQLRVKIDGIYSKRDIKSVITKQDEAEAS